MSGWWWNRYGGSGWRASASFQPPAYHAQEIPLPDRRSPIVAKVWLGNSRFAGTVAGCGALTLKAVFTAKWSEVTKPSFTILPLASNVMIALVGAVGNTGVRAAISQTWFRNEPPNAAWKKLSHSV